MGLFGKKEAPEVNEPMDLDAVMKKFDRESNTRIWEGKPKILVSSVLAVFSLFCNMISFSFFLIFCTKKGGHGFDFPCHLLVFIIKLKCGTT